MSYGNPADSPVGREPVARGVVSARPKWHVLWTKPYQERRVAAQLGRRNIESYCPLLKAFRRNLLAGQRQVEPLFPCYLFVRTELAACYTELRRISGVRDVLRFGGCFAWVDAHVISELRRRETPDGYIRARPAQHKLQAPQPVVITGGLFAGQTGLFTRRLNGPQRICVLLDLLKRQVPVNVPAARVRPLALEAS